MGENKKKTIYTEIVQKTMRINIYFYYKYFKFIFNCTYSFKGRNGIAR